jgi:hypothetical protein
MTLFIMLPLILGHLALVQRRQTIEARPNGVVLYRALLAAIYLAAFAVLCSAVFNLGFQMGGDVARRDARNEAMAAATA